MTDSSCTAVQKKSKAHISQCNGATRSVTFSPMASSVSERRASGQAMSVAENQSKLLSPRPAECSQDPKMYARIQNVPPCIIQSLAQG